MDPAGALKTLASLLHNYSVEISPTNQKSISFAAERLAPGTEVYLRGFRARIRSERFYRRPGSGAPDCSRLPTFARAI